MKFFLFHFMPYKYLPEGYEKEYETVWVRFPNSFYDPQKGAELYNEYLDEMVYAEEMGFDGVCVNEHHQNAYGNMPSPNIIAALLASRTKRVKIAIAGNALPLRAHPLRLAEEIAMLDVVTRGRMISGFVRGIGAEYHSFVINPNESRPRFNEAHDLILKAWTEDGPFSFEGKYYNVQYVNPWPRPFQKPHPPIWIPSSGSFETIDWAAERRYTYLQTHTAYKNVQNYLGSYHRTAKEKFGYTSSPYQVGWNLPIYVAESDQQAIEEAAEGIEVLYNKLTRMPPEMLFPPGFSSERSEIALLKNKQTITGRGTGAYTIKDLMDDGTVLVGSVDTVVERLCQCHRELNLGYVIALLQFGTLSHEKTMNNIRMFGQEVIPRVKEKLGVIS